MSAPLPFEFTPADLAKLHQEVPAESGLKPARKGAGAALAALRVIAQNPGMTKNGWFSSKDLEAILLKTGHAEIWDRDDDPDDGYGLSRALGDLIGGHCFKLETRRGRKGHLYRLPPGGITADYLRSKGVDVATIKRPDDELAEVRAARRSRATKPATVPAARTATGQGLLFPDLVDEPAATANGNGRRRGAAMTDAERRRKPLKELIVDAKKLPHRDSGGRNHIDVLQRRSAEFAKTYQQQNPPSLHHYAASFAWHYSSHRNQGTRDGQRPSLDAAIDRAEGIAAGRSVQNQGRLGLRSCLDILISNIEAREDAATSPFLNRLLEIARAARDTHLATVNAGCAQIDQNLYGERPAEGDQAASRPGQLPSITAPDDDIPF